MNISKKIFPLVLMMGLFTTACDSDDSNSGNPPSTPTTPGTDVPSDVWYAVGSQRSFYPVSEAFINSENPDAQEAYWSLGQVMELVELYEPYFIVPAGTVPAVATSNYTYTVNGNTVDNKHVSLSQNTNIADMYVMQASGDTLMRAVISEKNDISEEVSRNNYRLGSSPTTSRDHDYYKLADGTVILNTIFWKPSGLDWRVSVSIFADGSGTLEYRDEGLLVTSASWNADGTGTSIVNYYSDNGTATENKS